ncbi:rab-GTPase-TBC domain-containing protein [Lipomyces arxii]|uniref:rab-GTPase-TBC domain-containing protein n=1 Tax=Lipomyces arxii TaxID=56418 RepID=UPI0034CEA522
MATSRTIDDTRRRWNKLFGGAFPSLTGLKSSVINGGTMCEDSLRSLCWKLFMLFPDLQPDTWSDILQTERQKYDDLKKKYLALHLKRAQESAGNAPPEEEKEDLNVVNPLSQDIQNPWNTFWKDEDLRKDILQDIERTFPDIEYFRDTSVQNTMLDILFVYTKMNPVVSYQQGMHEILAPIFLVIANDSLKPATDVAEGDRLMYETLSSEYIEHDSFTLFNFIMQNAWEWYAAIGKVKGPSENGRVMPPIVVKARKIQDNYLRKIDPQLERHLRTLGIEPQIWGIRWIRLLFGREFEFSSLLSMWDCLFAADSHTLDLVDFVCIAMLLRIRDQLLLADYTGALTLLLHYPINDAMAPCTFVEDAIYLQVHVTPSGGRRIAQQYMPVYDEPPEMQHPLHIINGMLIPGGNSTLIQRRAQMEKAMSGIAKNMMDTSERFGNDMNKYVREKVRDVRVRATTAIQQSGVQYVTPETSGIRSLSRPTRYQDGSKAQSIPQASRARNIVAFDDAEYIRERHDHLAKVLTASLDGLSSLLGDAENRSKYKEALDRIEYVKKCLLFDNVKMDKKNTLPILAAAAVAASPSLSASDESASIENPISRYNSDSPDPLDSSWAQSLDASRGSPSSDIGRLGASSLESSKAGSILFDPPISSSVDSSKASTSVESGNSLFETKPSDAGHGGILTANLLPSANLFGSNSLQKPSLYSVASNASPASPSQIVPTALSAEEAKLLLGM